MRGVQGLAVVVLGRQRRFRFTFDDDFPRAMFRRVLFLSKLLTFLAVGECGRYRAPKGSDVTFPYRRIPTINELIEDAGYRYDRHNVTTDDGLILALHRISSNADDDARGVPVLMINGFAFQSDGWLLLGNDSLPIVLSNLGYDVWLGDYRGSARSLEHTIYSPDDFRAYNYSFHEQGMYDVPAFIDHILGITRKPKVLYIGISLGAGILFVMNSERPEYNDKLLGAAMMAPLGNMLKFEDNDFSYRSFIYYGSHLANGAFRIGVWLFPWAKDLPLAKQALLAGCSSPILNLPCRATTFHLLGLSDSTDPSTVFYQVATGLTTQHIKVARHMLQLIMHGRFSKFDFGFEKNLDVYGEVYPPNYNLSRTVVPVFIIHGGRDLQVRPQAAVRTSRQLGNLYKRKLLPSFNHADFILGTNAPKMLYEDIVDYFDELTEKVTS